MENIMDYIVGDALIVVPALIVVGQMVKNTPKVKNWVIPYVLLILGIVTTVAIMGLNVDAVLQGVLVSGAAVFGNQLWKQIKENTKLGGTNDEA